MPSPLVVSIGIPAYDRPEGLRRTLECMLAQTYSNIEIIVSDNCSPNPKVEEILNEFSARDTRIRHYKQKCNIGAPENFKFVESKASGDLFMWASDDDLWEKSFIELGVQALNENPEYDAWFCTIENIDKFDRVVCKYRSFERFTSTGRQFLEAIKFVFEPESLGKANMIYSIYKRDALKEVMNVYFISEQWGSDYCFNLAFLLRFRMLFSEKVLLQKRLERKDERLDTINMVKNRHPHRQIFPLFKSYEYTMGLFRAAIGTRYWPIVLIIMPIRVLSALRNDVFNHIRRFKAYVRGLRVKT